MIETQRDNLPSLVFDAINEIHVHYAEVYGVADIAENLGVTKNHLIRCFSSETGISPGKYLMQIRVDMAKKMLQHKKYPLHAIAAACGFANANYLCRVFKRITGMTPQQWRTCAVASDPDGDVENMLESLYL
jgi:transcriptional regulator GlxA family with amidase domain